MAKRRGSLVTNLAVKKRDEKAPAPASDPGGDVRAVSIALPPDDLKLLRRVAIERADRAGGGRPSVSSIIRDLVDRHRAELEKEAG